MGADPDKLPNKTAWAQTLEKEIGLPLKEKKLFYLVWVQNGIPVGHSNLTFLEYGKEAHMHLHLWNPNVRKKGLGLEFLNQCIPYYFECFKLKILIFFVDSRLFQNLPSRRDDHFWNAQIVINQKHRRT